MGSKNLQGNYVGMSVLRFMAESGRSNEDIRRVLYDIFGYEWTLETINKHSNRFPLCHKKVQTSIDMQEMLESGKSKKDISQLQRLRDLNPEDLSFGELCEHAASFFEYIERYPKGRRAPGRFWNDARSKIEIWDQRRKIMWSMDDYKHLTESQKHAYNYCDELHNKPPGLKTGAYGIVYQCYRYFRDCLEQQQKVRCNAKN